MWKGVRSWFDAFLEPTEDRSRAGLFYLFVAAVIATIVIVIIAVGLFLAGYKPGEFGDFLGGTLNPLLTFLTFMGLLITIVLQQTELRDTRVELERSATALESQLKANDRQNFESTFFQMLTLHNTIVNSIDLHYSGRPSGSDTKGRDCFKQFFENFRDQYYGQIGQDERERLQMAYDLFWEHRQQDLAHYYRYLYNVLRFVYESKGIEDKMPYVKLLRAQLSDYELVLLFYTALNKHGINYWIYIHEYQLLDNLLPSLLIEPGHKSLYSPKSFGEPKKPIPLKWPPAALAEDHENEKSASLKLNAQTTGEGLRR